MHSGWPGSGCYDPAGLLPRPFPLGPVPAVVSPRTSCMLDNPRRIHQTFIAILLLAIWRR